MSEESWNQIKTVKGFYVNTYRTICTILIVSMLLNVLLVWLIEYTYLDRPSPVYYSTNGVTPPQELIPMSEPNETSIPLLATQDVAEEVSKELPK